MFIRVKKSKNSPRKTVQIVQSVRQKDKVRQKTLRYIGVAMDEEELKLLMQLAESIKAKMEQEGQLSLFSPEELAKLKRRSEADTRLDRLNADGKNFQVDIRELKEESRVIDGIHDVYGTMYEQLNLGSIFTARQNRSGEIFKEMVLARIASPGSKLATTALLQRSFGQSIDVNAVYRMMDQITDTVITQLQDRVYQETVSLFGNNLDVIFFDATTLYYESFSEDSFRRNGYSKDMKFNQPQVLMALMVTREGLPVGYEVFPGNTYEGHTLIPCLQALRKKYGVTRVVFVADSGMYNQKNIEALVSEGFEYIVGARIKSTGKAVQDQILDTGSYVAVNSEESYTVIHLDGERLVVNYSTSRAKKNRFDRIQAIDKLKQRLSKQSKLGAKDLLNNYGYKKYLKATVPGELVIDEAKLQLDEKWDGLMGIKTNSPSISPIAAIRQYQQLWIVEEAFRINKHTLEIRPIFHYKETRVKAHIAICFAAFALMAQLRYRIKIQQVPLSLNQIHEALLSVQTSILYNKKNGFSYSLPSSLSKAAKQIYKTLNIHRSHTPKIIDS